MEMAKLSIIIPVYYGAELLWDCYNSLREKVLFKLSDYEVVMVDDGSQDHSWEVMCDIATQDEHVKLIKLSRNFGANKASYVGFCEASGDCAALLPQDLQTPAEMVLEMFDSWQRGNKVVVLTRSTRSDPKLTSKLFYHFARKYVNNAMPQGGLDIGMLDRRAMETLKLMDENDSAVLLQILWMGFKTEVLSYARQERISGKSGYNFQKRVKLAIDSIIGFSYFPIKLITTISVIFFVVGVLWALWLLSQRLLVGIEVEGWTTIMVVMLISFGLIMLSLAILGEYIWRTLDAARHRPVYVIDEVVEAGGMSDYEKVKLD
jgi:dolichol-phosphate mannosyltransferase